MHKIRLTLVFMACLAAPKIYGLHLGIGYSSMTDGRMIPGVNAGMFVTKNWLVSGCAAGVASKVYYSNMYSLNALYYASFGKTWLGSLSAGAGFGGMYGRKAILVETEQENGEDKEVVDSDFMIGPSFRTAFYPVNHLYFAIDYMLGLGSGSLGLGFGDTGMFAIGVEL